MLGSAGSGMLPGLSWPPGLEEKHMLGMAAMRQCIPPVCPCWGLDGSVGWCSVCHLLMGKAGVGLARAAASIVRGVFVPCMGKKCTTGPYVRIKDTFTPCTRIKDTSAPCMGVKDRFIP